MYIIMTLYGQQLPLSTKRFRALLSALFKSLNINLHPSNSSILPFSVVLLVGRLQTKGSLLLCIYIALTTDLCTVFIVLIWWRFGHILIIHISIACSSKTHHTAIANHWNDHLISRDSTRHASIDRNFAQGIVNSLSTALHSHLWITFIAGNGSDNSKTYYGSL